MNTLDAGASPDASFTPSDAALPSSFRGPVAPAFTNATSDPRTIRVTITGEAEAQSGFDYTASPPTGERVFVDGWQLRFARVLTTVANVRLNRPGTTPTDQSSVGPAVFINPRAFAVNLSRPGSITAGGEASIPLMVISAAEGGGALDPAVRYAFSYDLVGAASNATNVNLDERDVAGYDEMLRNGWTWLIEGTATYQGAPAMMGAVFASYPSAVRFRFGFGADARYVNCHNPDNGGDAMPGVAPNANNAVTAQITLHMDHFFWSALGVEDPALRFDQLAARANAMGEVTMRDLAGVAPTNLRDTMNRAVPDRGGQTAGYTPRDANALSFDLGGNTGLADLRDFAAFSQRASGHLNSEGLCAVRPVGGFRY